MEAGYIVPVDDEVDRQMETVESYPSHANSETIKIVVEDFVQDEISYINELVSLESLGAYITTSKYLSLKESEVIFRPVRQLIDLHVTFLLNVERNLFRAPRWQTWAPAFEFWSNHTKLYAAVISRERRNKALLRRRMALPIKEEMNRCLELLSVPSRRPEEYLRFVEVRLRSPLCTE